MKRSVPVLALVTILFGAGSATLAADEAGAAPDALANAPVVTLAEALRAARAHQPALDLARGNATNAHGVADQARGALLPQLSGTVSYKRGTSNFVPQPGGTTLGTVPALTSSLTTFPQWFAGLNASQLVYDFGETINRWKAARVAADAADESTHTTEAQVAYSARSAFFTARAAKDLVGVARDTLANQEKHLAQVTGFVEVGTHPEIDLSQAKADRATAQLQLINAENNYDVARAMEAVFTDRLDELAGDLGDRGFSAFARLFLARAKAGHELRPGSTHRTSSV